MVWYIVLKMILRGSFSAQLVSSSPCFRRLLTFDVRIGQQRAPAKHFADLLRCSAAGGGSYGCAQSIFCKILQLYYAGGLIFGLGGVIIFSTYVGKRRRVYGKTMQTAADM